MLYPILVANVIFPIWGNRREGDHPQSHTVGAELNINSIDKVFTSAIAIITYRNTTIAIYVISFNVRILHCSLGVKSPVKALLHVASHKDLVWARSYSSST